ncbi:MAG: UDP-N-acetylmuramoyl-tripeptide--D-alanyl-D-alanine ligase [Gammaproteobacteria bacterium]|nr:UDP-N-acetylmuramoyl-tripeptide--D-alanyl-D-alanine ligase [Gammaproteobacteria bacterium]
MSTGTLAQASQQVEGRLVGADRPYVAVSTDTRTLARDELFVALEGPAFDGNAFVTEAAKRGAAGAIVSRLQVCELAQVEVADTRSALGRLAHAWRSRFDIPLIAVTGSNGKTTVKGMLAAILGRSGPTLATRGNLNNDIGLPLTLLRLDASHRAAVVELGANHAGEIACLTSIASPGFGLVTNAAPAHLEGFGNLEGVARAKGELFAGLPGAGTAVINADDPWYALWREMAGARRIVTFGLMRDADVHAGSVEQRLTPAGPRLAFDVHLPDGSGRVELPLAGRHNVANAVAAAAAAWAAGSTLDAIASGLAATQPAPGRLQCRRGSSGACVIDDTYNANPCSLAAALEFLTGLDGRAWLVLGDMRELGADAAALHADMGALAGRLGVERLYAVGPMSRHAVAAFGDGALWFAGIDELNAALGAELDAGVNVLVKASRGMRLERVVAALVSATVEDMH